ncbi:YciI family protein [Neorhodopirellula lusitana]|uniref:YciI family protein n=1 Tax=Neorhodopirellula lusitana TaxID=445327 RepID=UPI00384A54D9
MRVMVIVKASTSSEAGELPSAELLEAMGKYNKELVKAGVMKSGDGLKPSSQGLRVRFRGSERIVTNGPFAETSELIAGYWLWDVASMEEAVDWVKRCPNPMKEESDIEIRPFFEMADFAESDPDGKVAAHEDELRAEVAMSESTLVPYLFFSGRCAEAIAFYEKTLGATIAMLMRFSESPDGVPEGMLQKGFEDKVMHATVHIGKLTLMCSDGCDDKSAFDGFRLALSLPSEGDCSRVFDSLAQGGTIDMPLTPTFWSPLYGMVTDQFGVGWMVMVPGEQS